MKKMLLLVVIVISGCQRIAMSTGMHIEVAPPIPLADTEFSNSKTVSQGQWLDKTNTFDSYYPSVKLANDLTANITIDGKEYKINRKAGEVLDIVGRYNLQGNIFTIVKITGPNTIPGISAAGISVSVGRDGIIKSYNSELLTYQDSTGNWEVKREERIIPSGIGLITLINNSDDKKKIQTNTIPDIRYLRITDDGTIALECNSSLYTYDFIADNTFIYPCGQKILIDNIYSDRSISYKYPNTISALPPRNMLY